MMGNFPTSPERVRLWIDAGVSVKGSPEHVFVKLYTHGTQENVMRMLFDDGGLERMLDNMRELGVPCSFVSARGMVEKILSIIKVGPMDGKFQATT